MGYRAISLSISRKGEAIKRLHALLRLGGYPVPANEINRKYFGKGTRDAVFNFQLKNALPATGIVDRDTLAILEANAATKAPPVPEREAKKATTAGDRLSCGAQGEEVALLHQLLAAVGLEIDEGEIKGQRFGATTGDAVRQLQLLAGQSPTGEVDQQILGLLKEALGRLQVNPPANDQPEPGEYCIEGDVTDEDGMPLAGATVVANAHELRNALEIGRSVTDARGHYRILCKAGDKQDAMSLRLRVLNKKRKSLYTSDVHFNVPNGASLPIALGGPSGGTPSEFSSIGVALKPHVSALRPEDLVEDEHFQDITFLAGKTGLSKTRVGFYSVAARLASATGLPPELFFGLLTQNVPPDAPVIAMASTSSGVDFDFNTRRILGAMLSTSDAVLTRAIDAAVAKNVIPSSYKSRAGDDLASLAPLRTDAALATTFGTGKTPIKVVLDAAAIPSEKQQKFIDLYSARRISARDFWTNIGRNPDFTPDDVETLHFAVDAGRHAKGHMPLVNKLLEMRQQSVIKTPADLARLSADDWNKLLNGTYKGQPIGIPANVTAENHQAAVDTFAHMLERNFERAFPTTAFSARLAGDRDSPFSRKERLLLADFLDAHPDFDLLHTNVDRYMRDNVLAVAGSDRDALREALNQSKRMIRLASRYAAIKPLLADGIHSSQQIYSIGRMKFVGKYRNHPEIGESEAQTIYYKAERTYALALSLAVNIRTIAQGCDPVAIGNAVPWLYQQDARELPNLATLFGSLDFSACDQSRTVLSPAAYLVDTLHFLSHRGANGIGKNVLDVLSERRPDLAQIKLNAANTNVVMPYIDLVNELLEDAVASPGASPAARQVAALGRQTTLTTEELNANPQWVNQSAYAVLANPLTVFPWTLPFDLPLSEARTYLGQIGVDRVRLMRTFLPSPGESASRLADLAIEGLMLSRAEADIITGAVASQPWASWGLNQNSNTVPDPVDRKITYSGSWIEVLSHVRVLLTRSGLTHLTLTQLLNTAFINPKAVIQLHNDPPDSSDLATMTLVDLAKDQEALERMHRFVRLMRRLGWDVYTLDSAITTLQGNTPGGLSRLNEIFLRRLYAVRTAMKRLRVPENAALALFGPIETRDIPEFPGQDGRRYSLYYKLFQNRAVLNPVDPAFDLNDERTEIRAAGGSKPPLLTDHRPTLMGAFEIPDAELALAIDAFTDGKLTLANLSALHRHVVLAKGLDLTISELISMKALFEAFETAAPYDPFDVARPELLAVFCDTVDRIRGTKFSLAGLDYLLRHSYDRTSGVAPDDMAVGTLLKSVLDGLNKIAAEHAFGPDPTGTETRKRLASVLSREEVDPIMAILSGKSEGDPEGLIKSCLGRYMDGPAAEANLTGGALEKGQARYEYVLKGLLAYLRRSRGTGLIVQQLADALALPVVTTATLVTEWFPSGDDPVKAMLDDFLVLLDVTRDPSNNNSPITLSPEESGTIPAGNRTVYFKLYFTYYMALDKAAKVINGFGLSVEETGWLRNHGTGYGWLDPARLPLTEQPAAGGRFHQWSRLADAVAIKKTLPSDGTPFTSLMDTAKKQTNVEYFKALEARTGWPSQSLRVLCGDPADTTKVFNPGSTDPQGLLSLYYPGDYRSERALVRLTAAFAMLRRLGIPADVRGWIGTTVTAGQADSIKQAVKAKYSADQWLQIARQLRDPLRERQRDALVAYLLAHPPAGVLRWNDANDVYSHFLIDVEMGACQGTTRIVQANAAVQLFVLRCILNLEPMVTVDSNADADWQQWQWMGRYRLWEANRKVFLYPENWIEPSLRKDKSSFMADLENDLLQNEVTRDTAEEALRKYIEKLDGVSRLQVAGIYNESAHDQQTLPANDVLVKIVPGSATIEHGTTCQFSAVVSYATNKAVTWTATGGRIDKNGLFTAPSMPGDCKVTATSVQDPRKSATVTVEVTGIIVKIDPPDAQPFPGGEQQFTATVIGTANQAVTWSATKGYITADGLFIAPGSNQGDCTVKATSVEDPRSSAIAWVMWG